MPLFTHMKTGDWKEYVIVSSIRTSVGGRVWINLNLSGSKAHTLLHTIFFYPFYLGEEEKKKESGILLAILVKSQNQVSLKLSNCYFYFILIFYFGTNT